MHFPEVYGSQIIPYEDGSKIGFIHMEELTPLTSDQTMSVADPAQAVGKTSRSAAPTGRNATFSESQIDAMSARDFEKNEEAIMEAMRSGNFTYDITGGAR